MNLGISFSTNDNIIKRFGESEEIFVHQGTRLETNGRELRSPSHHCIESRWDSVVTSLTSPLFGPLGIQSNLFLRCQLILLCGWFWHWKEALNRTDGWIEGEIDGCLCHSPSPTTAVIKWQILDVDGSRSEAMTSQPPNRRRGTRWRLMCPLAFPAPEKEPTWPRERENEENEREDRKEQFLLSLSSQRWQISFQSEFV